MLAILAMLALFVPSCSSDNSNIAVIKVTSNNGIIEITDSLGRVTPLDEVPQRLISLAPSNTEILFALGLGDKVVGVTSYCNYPAEAEEKPQVGGFSTVDLEKVVAQDPDLILAANIHEEEVIPQLESRGLNVISLTPKTAEDVIQAIEAIGQITGTEPEATSIVDEMNNRLNTIADLVKKMSDEEKPRVFYALWHDPLMTAGYDTLQSHIIELAGGKNIFNDLERYPTVNLEVLVERNPQVIVAGVGHGSGKGATLDWAETDEQIGDTSARKNNNVFEINADLVSRAGPRIVDAVEEMFRLLHPYLAEDL